MIAFIKSILPDWIKQCTYSIRAKIFDLNATKSYSQEGEDLVLRRIFENQTSGFYVDVGAHHPQRFSNTNLFYKKGWCGINIEPNPDSVTKFSNARQRDINIQCGVANTEETLTYHKFDEPALNTFDASVVANRLANTKYRVVEEIQVPVRRLKNILNEYLSPIRHIDFLNIDVEGLDLSVLKSNDWERYRPTIVLTESLNSSLEDMDQNEIARFMSAQGYSIFAKTYNTWIFKDKVGRLPTAPYTAG